MKKKRGIPEDEMSNKERIERVLDVMQIPSAALTDTTHFEMNGNREVIVDGCKGILEYDENVIRINTGRMITEFTGRNLSIKSMTEDALIVKGFITSIKFVT